MNRSSMWKVVAVVVLVLGASLVVFGMNLMPTRAAAEAKGTFAPWLLTWGMIWLTVVMTVVLAKFLFSPATKT